MKLCIQILSILPLISLACALAIPVPIPNADPSRIFDVAAPESDGAAAEAMAKRSGNRKPQHHNGRLQAHPGAVVGAIAKREAECDSGREDGVCNDVGLGM